MNKLVKVQALRSKGNEILTLDADCTYNAVCLSLRSTENPDVVKATL